jgi:hypothetical protein
MERVSRISSGAYATLDSASEANTGSAMRFGRRVCCSRSDRNGRPSRSRFSSEVGLATNAKGTTTAAGARGWAIVAA